MRRATLACASLLLLAGLTAGCGDDSGDDSKKDDETSSASPTDSTESADASDDASEESDDTTDDESSEAPSDGASVDPSNADFCQAAEDATAAEEIDDLKDAVGDLVENLPDDAGSDAEAGLAYLESALAKSSSEKQFVQEVEKATPEQQAAVQAYSAFESETCSMPAAPSTSPSN
ncbi:hypothetical protein [Nocardioides sp. Soil796]|uniref:hypothetical protein n=1 Tax=Nocardioides sp. Soil796 TaxID=1736412 RepID=UPI000709C4EB|nr:hypothetical protein [Nocardioides sp. Soil796]KRF20291.1 hypothetical protein ASH02_21445 [Nocardioides sp. Soil796]